MVKKARTYDAAGWGTWAILFGILLVPGIFAAMPLQPFDASAVYPYLMGPILAAIMAGIVTVGINTVLQRRAIRKQRDNRRPRKRK